jgi:transglutaminase-like putative cysteine protease
MNRRLWLWPLLLFSALVPAAARESLGYLELKGTYRFEVKPDPDRVAEGTGTQLWWSAPKEWGTQRMVRIESIVPPPKATYIDPRNGNAIYYWDFDNASKPAFETRFAWRSLSFSNPVRLNAVEPIDEKDEILKACLAEDAVIALTPAIRELAERLGSTESNPMLRASVFFHWVVKNLVPPAGMGQTDPRYLLPDADKRVLSKVHIVGAPEYSFLFCALCRAGGIPARPVAGFLVPPGESLPHVWAEFYVSPFGWIPADPWLAHAAPDKQRFEIFPQDPDFYFANLDPYRLVLSKGSSVDLRPPPASGDDGIWIRRGRASYFLTGVWNARLAPRNEYALTVEAAE